MWRCGGHRIASRVPTPALMRAYWIGVSSKFKGGVNEVECFGRWEQKIVVHVNKESRNRVAAMFGVTSFTESGSGVFRVDQIGDKTRRRRRCRLEL